MSDRRPYRVLVVEDEAGLADSIRYTLETEGFDVLVAVTGPAGVETARVHEPDVVLLDLMLPGMSGLDVCRQIRTFSDAAIIMLTAKDAESDKVVGLELGADDYMTKPFSVRELVARIRSHLRRMSRTGLLADSNEVIRGGPVEMDIDAHVVRVNGDTVDMTPKEFDLLESLIRRKNRLAERHALIDEVWGPSYFGDTKTLDVHIKRVREKIEVDPSHPRHLVTVRGLGYKFVDE